MTLDERLTVGDLSLLMVATEFPPGPGGIGSHAWSVARRLSRQGWRVTVAAPQDYASDEEILDFKARLAAYGGVRDGDGTDGDGTDDEIRGRGSIELIRLHHWPGAVIQGAVWALRLGWVILRRRPRLILASGQRAVWLAAALHRIFRLPLAVVGHGTELAGKSGWEARLNRASFSRADLSIWVSRYTREVAMAAGIRARRSEVVPNGADSERFRRLSESELADFRARHPVASADRTLLLTVGHVDRRKGQDLVIRALPKLAQTLPNVHYLMLGLPTRGEELETLARELGVEQRVHLLGRRSADELLGFLNACDLFVMASRHTASGDFEGFGIAVVEAALCGKLAVVSDDSGLVEAIEPGETGLSVPPEDVDALAARMLELLEDPQRRQAMGQRAYDRARAEQTWDRRGQQYHRLLLQCLEPGAQPPGRPSPTEKAEAPP